MLYGSSRGDSACYYLFRDNGLKGKKKLASLRIIVSYDPAGLSQEPVKYLLKYGAIVHTYSKYHGFIKNNVGKILEGLDSVGYVMLFRSHAL